MEIIECSSAFSINGIFVNVDFSIKYYYLYEIYFIKETYPKGIELYTIITEKKNNYLVTSLKILSYVMVGYFTFTTDDGMIFAY